MKDIIARMMTSALRAVAPDEAVRRFVKRQGRSLVIDGRSFNLDSFQRIFLVGAGKASVPMALAMAALLGERLTEGVIITKEGFFSAASQPMSGLRIIEGGHPIPDERSLNGGREIAALLQNSRADDLVIALISGGASALLTLPAEGISLQEIQQTTNALLRCGATINEINTLRKHLSGVKGGGLARLASPAPLAALILSDVVGDPLHVIASGPTVADPSTFRDAMGIIRKYQLEAQLQPAVLSRMEGGLSGRLQETPKPADPLFNRVQNVLIGSNLLAARAAAEAAQQSGFHSAVLSTFLEGEASEVGKVLAALGKGLSRGQSPLALPACLVLGGETTVTIKGKGKGGRNQEMALSAAIALEDWPGVTIVCFGTDGNDGPTDAAGAVVDGRTISRARELGLNPLEALSNNDSYHFFSRLGDLLKTGPTHTNVNDLAFILAENQP